MTEGREGLPPRAAITVVGLEAVKGVRRQQHGWQVVVVAEGLGIFCLVLQEEQHLNNIQARMLPVQVVQVGASMEMNEYSRRLVVPAVAEVVGPLHVPAAGAAVVVDH